jgi:hypothetical protein
LLTRDIDWFHCFTMLGFEGMGLFH